MKHTYSFWAPTTFLDPDTGKLEVRMFGLKLEDIEDEDKDTYIEKAKESIENRIKDICEEKGLKAAYQTVLVEDGKGRSLDKVYV